MSSSSRSPSPVPAPGLTYCVAVTLGLLFYLATVTLDQFITVIVVLFGCVLVLLVNLLLLYGSSRAKPHLLVPWLAVTLPITLALLIYTAVKFWDLAPYQSVYVAALLLSTYFCAVVVTHIHELRAQQVTEKPQLEDPEAPAAASLLEGEETVLVELGSPGLPQPEEVISVEQLKVAATNPFLEDVFKVKAMQKAAKQTLSATSMEIRSDFTPFKKLEEVSGGGGEDAEADLPAKLRIFLPHTGDGEESDFDFSFNDPAFDSSLIAVRKPED